MEVESWKGGGGEVKVERRKCGSGKLERWRWRGESGKRKGERGKKVRLTDGGGDWWRNGKEVEVGGNQEELFLLTHIHSQDINTTFICLIPPFKRHRTSQIRST